MTHIGRDVADGTVPTGTVAIPNGSTKLSLLLDEDAPFIWREVTRQPRVFEI